MAAVVFFDKTNLMKAIIPFFFVGILMSCQPNNMVSINIESENSEIDSIYIVDLITEEILFQIPAKGVSKEKIQGRVAYPTAANIQTRDGRQSYLTILNPGKELHIDLKSDSMVVRHHIADSLLNYLSKSNNEFIAQNGGTIFSAEDPVSIVRLLEDFKTTRKAAIENRASDLSSIEKEILLYQNSARVYSFLFFVGRIAKKLPPDHDFFTFIERIDNNTQWTKTLPQNLLYKHEINYLLAHGSIESNEAFLDYVASQTSNADLLDFLKATYIGGVITAPSYWPKHEEHLSASVLKKFLAREASNQYYDLIVKTSNSFFSSQKGVRAFDFEAERLDGSKVKLSDFKGKIVFIDSWATWCGPCIAHRPNVLKLADKYADHNGVEILMISMDADRAEWHRYLARKDQLGIKGDLIIENGMRSEYGDRFNVKGIPKYMLIDAEGVIIKADIPEPSVAVEEMIERELRKM